MAAVGRGGAGNNVPKREPPALDLRLIAAIQAGGFKARCTACLKKVGPWRMAIGPEGDFTFYFGGIGGRVWCARLPSRDQGAVWTGMKVPSGKE
jgi:hypothetical protein